jgi:hypothetical protein
MIMVSRFTMFLLMSSATLAGYALLGYGVLAPWHWPSMLAGFIVMVSPLWWMCAGYADRFSR